MDFPNLFRHILLVGLFSSITISLHSQIHVDSLKDVGIGTNDPEGAKMKIQTTDESKALHIYNDSPDSISKYGIYINTRSTGVGEKYGIFNHTIQNSLSDDSAYGLYNEISPEGAGAGYGIYNHVKAPGLGPKYGIFNNVFSNDEADAPVNGIYNITRNGRGGNIYGIYNYARLLRPLLDDAVGFFNYVAQTTNTTNGHIFGIDNLVIPGDSTSDKSVYGVKSVIENKGEFEKYGIYAQVTSDTTSGDPIYGMYSEVYSEGDTASIYGVHSTATTTDSTIGYGIYASILGVNASNSWAGYFDGNVHCTLGMWQSSDRDLKENIEDFTRGLELIEHLRPVTFNYRQDLTKGVSDKKQYGFIAQEVEEILPDIVKEVRTPGKTIYETKVNEIGDKENGTQQVITTFAVGEEPSTPRMAMNYTALIPILIKAVQEQQDVITSQQLLIEDLMGRMEKMEQILSINDKK